MGEFIFSTNARITTAMATKFIIIEYFAKKLVKLLAPISPIVGYHFEKSLRG